MNTILIIIGSAGSLYFLLKFVRKYKRNKYLKNAIVSTPCKFKLNNKWYNGTIADITTNENGVKNVQVAYFDYEYNGKVLNKTEVKYHYCKLTDTKKA
jgi:hypothetical protein